MTKLTLDITMSLDGFVAGPDATLEKPLGEGADRLHEWLIGTATFRREHGLGEDGETGLDDDLAREYVEANGAYLMGRKMFSGGAGPWEDDPNADGWWGDDPPFRLPVFVLTHHPRETVTKQNGSAYVFVTEGPEAALEQARSAAGGRNVAIAGGADVAQQYLRLGLVDELQIHLVPQLLGSGVPLFGGVRPELELTRVVDSPRVTHLRYRVTR
jgi:dihydrofolate reductase